MNKLNQKLSKICKKADARPIVTANILLILAITIAGIVGVEVTGRDIYLSLGSNPVSRLGIEEKDTIILGGRVSDMEIRESFGTESQVLRLTNVRLMEKVENEAMTNLVKNDGKSALKITNTNQSVQVWLKNDSSVLLGNTVVVKGELDYFDRATNPGQFDAYKFYKNRGYLFGLKKAEVLCRSSNYSVVSQAMRRLRNRLENIIDEIYSAEDAAIIKAMVLGDKANLDSRIKESFQKNGIAHILAISGLHISFLCMGLYSVLNSFGIRPLYCSLISGVFLILYVVMVGISVSSCRAGICFLVFLLSKPLKRSYDTLSALSLASIMLLISQPGYLYDTAFRLSFLAVVALVIFYKWFTANVLDIQYKKRMFLSERKTRLKQPLIFAVNMLFTMAESLLVSGMVFLVTLPIIVNCYHEVSWYSILLNILVVPLMGVLLVSSICAIFLTLTVKIFAILPLYLSKIILLLFKITCVTLESSEAARSNVGHAIWYKILIYYILLAFICKYGGRYKNTVFVTGVITLLMILCLRVHSGFDLYMVDVGQGDCFIGINDSGRVYIFDGGSSSVSGVGDNRIIPVLKYLGVDEIEAVFLSHPDEDHVNGIFELLSQAGQECLEIKNIYAYSGFLEDGQFDELLACADENTRIYGINSDFCLNDGKLKIECLYPVSGTNTDDSNNASLVCRLEYGNFSMLETGDIEKETEMLLLNKEETRINADILKVAHHGSKSSSTMEFLESVSPKLALISVGYDNRYGHPNNETLSTLETVGAQVLRSDISGCVYLHTDGDKIKVRCWNNY